MRDVPRIHRAPFYGGFSFGAGRAGKVAAAVFDPATLSLTGWWRADSTTGYVAGTWDGVASAGGSGSRDLTQGTGGQQPGTSISYSGHTAPDFDGTDDVLANATAISTMLSASAWRGWWLVHIDAISANSATSYLNDCIMQDSGAYWGIYARANGGSPLVYAYQWDGAEKAASANLVGVGVDRILIQARYDGTDIRLKVNGGTVQTAAAGSISTTTGTIVCGAADSAGNRPFNGQMLDVGLLATAGSDADFDDIIEYVNDRYGLSF